MMTNKRFFAALALVSALALTACGQSESDSAYPAEAIGMSNGSYNSKSTQAYGGAAEAYEDLDYVSESYMEEGGAWDTTQSGETSEIGGESFRSAVTSGSGSAVNDSRKLIRTVNLDVETKEFDQMLAEIEEQVAKLNGYIEQMDTYNGSKYSGSLNNRSSDLTVRVPKQSLDTFLKTVDDTGNIVSRTESVEDVTLDYVDTESRKSSLLVEQERLLSFLEKAESLEDIITLEERLSEVRYQLERMESRLRTYDNKVDYATVYMSIREVKELTPPPVEEEEETVWERLSNGFMENLIDVKDGIVDFFVWIVVDIPYLVIWAVRIAVIVFIVRLIIRYRRKRNAAKMADIQAAPPMENKQD
ncbi:MAG: DUF4349 domain-containing protein [Butyrivibrio sp.]|nr:DUF4349 domain-containing protein [Muribaculum sp.]MCM1553261.1 DUF4349 domain-containing protein [Butyrivibrio sp.]